MCELLPQDFDGLAKLLLDEVGPEAIRRCEEVVGLVGLVPRVGLRRDAEFFHADLACTDGAVNDEPLVFKARKVPLLIEYYSECRNAVCAGTAATANESSTHVHATPNMMGANSGEGNTALLLAALDRSDHHHSDLSCAPVEHIRVPHAET